MEIKSVANNQTNLTFISILDIYLWEIVLAKSEYTFYFAHLKKDRADVSNNVTMFLMKYAAEKKQKTTVL